MSPTTGSARNSTPQNLLTAEQFDHAVKAEIARKNARKSTGPRTLHGKAASARNARKHGFASSRVDIDTLDDSQLVDFLAHIKAYIEDFQPQSEIEAEFVRQAAEAQWQIDQIDSAQSAVVKAECDRQMSLILDSAPALAAGHLPQIEFRHVVAIAHQALASEPGPILNRLHRYHTSHARALDRAIRGLFRARAERERLQAVAEEKQNKAAAKIERNSNPPRKALAATAGSSGIGSCGKDDPSIPAGNTAYAKGLALTYNEQNDPARRAEQGVIGKETRRTTEKMPPTPILLRTVRMDRRAFLRGIGGATLALPVLDAMGAEVTSQTPRRFCAIYTANGMSLPRTEHAIDDWSFFPTKGEGASFEFGKSTEPLAPHRKHLSFMGGLHHPSGPKADPHTCSDMWLTGAPLHNPKPGTYNTAGLDQVIALHTKQYCRQPSLVMSIDAGTGFLSRTGTISYSLEGRPIPAENNPRRIFNRLFRAGSDEDRASLQSERAKLQRRIKLVDAVAESARSLDKQLGKSDREKMEQYLTSLNEVESRLIASEKWIDIPLKKQDYSHLNLDVTSGEGEPAEYYRNMFDLIALAFDADITRSVAFMLNREDGMGISDTFPLKLGLSKTHHNLSHATDKEGQLQFAKYDQFLCTQVAHFLKRLNSYADQNGSGSVLDNTIVLFGSGASTTHNPRNLPTLIAGGSNMGLNHGVYWREKSGAGETRMSNVYLSILRSMGIERESFADSTGTLTGSIFSRT
jgi:hypothetical protein